MDEAATVQAARTRARRRLIGAAVLVGVGIIGFPLLFETQPRPIAVDIPIEIPARDKVPPLKLPPEKGSAATAPRAAGPVVAEVAPPVQPAPPAATPQAPAEPASAARPAVPASASASAARPAVPAADIKAEAQRAQALLDGKPVAVAPPAAAASAPKTSRFVVQAGAYTDAATLREARQKVEKLGLKTYTQVIETDSGTRTRVRVGPFETREEAEKAAVRIKSSGLAANVLSL
jgi:DedD protein